MTGIKFCGMTRPCDLEAANRLKPDDIGFVFAKKSRRFIPPDRAAELKRMLSDDILAVGVFVDAPLSTVAELLNQGVIDIAQLHGHEDETWLRHLRSLTDRPVWKAFRITNPEDLLRAEVSGADRILLDAGAGDGAVFDWSLLDGIHRPYILAGGLNPENVTQAIRTLHPQAVDVSSGIETGGFKDPEKMAAFVKAVREEETV